MSPRLAVILLTLTPLLGCSAPRSAIEVSNPDPAGKIPAIKQVVRAKDMSAARQLVKDLDSDDSAVRFYAINGLHRLTNENFDYHYFDDDLQRKPALDKWKAWLAAQERAHGNATATTAVASPSP